MFILRSISCSAVSSLDSIISVPSIEAVVSLTEAESVALYSAKEFWLNAKFNVSDIRTIIKPKIVLSKIILKIPNFSLFMITLFYHKNLQKNQKRY